MTVHLAYAQDDFYNAVNEANEYAKELRNQRATPTFDDAGNLTHNGNIIFSTEELSGQQYNSYAPADTNTYGSDSKTLMGGETAQKTYDKKTLDTAESAGERAYHITKSSFNRQKPDLSNDPIWSVTDDVFNNLEEIASGFANCEISTELVSNGREIHVPKYEICTKLPAIEASFTINHEYDVGVIKHRSGPVNLSPCGLGCLEVWLGTIGDDYWGGYCSVYEEAMSIEVIQPQSITAATLARSKFDDYHQVYLNGTKVWNGPNELFPPETEGSCELNTSWDLNPNVDLLGYFTELTPHSDLNFLTRTSVTDGGEGYSLVRVHYNYEDLIYNDVWTDAEKIAQAHEIQQQLDDGFCTGEIRCTNMPTLDAEGCTTINGLRVCESNFGDNPLSELGISPFCKSVSVSSTCDFNKGEWCTTDLQGVEHCYDNTTENRNTCTEYEANPECSYIKTECVEGTDADSGNCYVQEDTYDCGFTVNEGTETEEDVLRCDGQLMCVGEGCYSPDRDLANTSFGEVNAYMEMLKFAFADMTCEGIPDRAYDPNNTPDDYLPVPTCDYGYTYNVDADMCLKQLSCAYSENDFYAASPRNGIQILTNNTVIADDNSITSCSPITIGSITYTCGEAKKKLATDTFYEVCANDARAITPENCPSLLHEINPKTGYCEVPPSLSCTEPDYTLIGAGTPFDDSDDICLAPQTEANYTCGAGFTLVNGQCSQTLTSNVQYSCPSGYTQNGTQCTKSTVETTARPLTCDQSNFNSGVFVCRYQSQTSTACSFNCTPDNYGGNGNPLPYSTSIAKTYGSCGLGWTANGSVCERTVTSTVGATLYCPSGYSLSGGCVLKPLQQPRKKYAKVVMSLI
ncbi:hypothetical protein [Vibrio halioticoli]|nr:hypothetical protein [Vibrio halioticoli]